MKEAGSGKPSVVCLDDNQNTYILQLYQILVVFCRIYFFVNTGPRLKTPQLSQNSWKRVELGSALVEDKAISADLHSPFVGSNSQGYLIYHLVQ